MGGRIATARRQPELELRLGRRRHVPDEIDGAAQRQVKNFCCLLLLANGTPMIRAGDEFMQRQGGNNNPYNQDNETSWIDWDLLQTNAAYFVSLPE